MAPQAKPGPFLAQLAEPDLAGGCPPGGDSDGVPTSERSPGRRPPGTGPFPVQRPLLAPRLRGADDLRVASLPGPDPGPGRAGPGPGPGRGKGGSGGGGPPSPIHRVPGPGRGKRGSGGGWQSPQPAAPPARRVCGPGRRAQAPAAEFFGGVLCAAPFTTLSVSTVQTVTVSLIEP